MRGSTLLRCILAVALAAPPALIAGCQPANRRESPPPAVRVRGATVLAPDPERRFEQGPYPLRPVEQPPAQEEPEPEPAEPEPPEAEPEPPPDVAPGVRVTLDLVDARAEDAVRALAYQGDVDIVLAGGADRRVTIRLQDTPWMEAFEAVLAGADMVVEWEGRRARVQPVEQFRAEQQAALAMEQQRQEALQRRRAAQEPVTEVIPLQNLYAEDAVKSLTPLLSDVGKIGLDNETNMLVVLDRPARIEAVRQAVRRLDTVPPQAMIEALIVDVTLDDGLSYGVNWDAAKTEGDTVTLLQALAAGAGTDPVVGPGGSVAFTLLGDSWSLTGLVDALRSYDNAKILANPKVLGINNRPAQIEIIDEIPFRQLTETSEGGQIGTTEFKEVGVKLGVTPRIADDGTVHLILSVEQSASTTAAIDEVPVVNTRRSSTIMTLRDGQTIALGGLRRYRITTQEDKVPVLGDMWLLGGLFRRVRTAEVESELVVFIRVRIPPHGQRLTDRQWALAEAINSIQRQPPEVRTDPLRVGKTGRQAPSRKVP